MTRQLPQVATELLKGRGAAQSIAETALVAYWLHYSDKSAALMHFENIHKDFAELAGALGYTIAPKEAAPERTAAVTVEAAA